MGIRIGHGVDKPLAVEISVDGKQVSAFSGEMLATALHANGFRRYRGAPRTGSPRGIFCFMGVCQGCTVEVDGRLVAACTEPVRAGMAVSLE